MGVFDDRREGRPRWFLALAGLSNAVIILIFLSYWNRAWLGALALFAETLFIAAMVWECYQVALDLRAAKLPSGDDGGHATNFLGILLFAVIFLPAFVIAGISAFGR